MTAAANKKLLQDIYAAVAKGDGTLFKNALADDAEITVTGRNSWSQTFKGKERILRDLYGYVYSLLKEPGRVNATRFIADEDWVAVQARGEMIVKSGERYENHYCLVFRIANGKIAEMHEYLDSALCERLLGPYPAEKKSQ